MLKMLTLSSLIPDRIKEYFNPPKPKDAKKEDTEFSFVWYFKMHIKSESPTGIKTTTSYTMPCRTKAKAKSYKEAKEKVENFALGKCELVVWQEEEYAHSELGQKSKEIKDSFKRINEIFAKF